ncbi:3-oxoacyl-[acyl-carrier protein] reductase [Roseomonas rosea]|uniref:3-oxoacyl-[acyl-carrier protein] reductase n=1 Tax=Muricoccus roseus TaxID=198092 RepID=A0A1M6I748_9PROT|nr:SDR family oxidoreductase [Roseomonas rosea]SHJ30270.1 3-oxoacyl-[acyl-carrier protein] reductase [Roseomonas rosea]
MSSAGRPVAAVTGGAGELGFAICRRLARAGMLPVMLDRDAARLSERAAALEAEFGLPPSHIALDLVAADAAARAMEQIAQRHGRLDCLVNNAGLSAGHQIASISLADWEAVMRINLTVPMLLAHAAMRFWRAQGSGSIVNMASRTWLSGAGPAYTASKAGLVGLTRSLAVQLGEFNVTVNAVAPSYVRSAFNSQSGPETERRHLRLGVLSRLATPEDVANAVAFLASGEARFITGEVLHVAGGAQLAGRPQSVAPEGQA